MTTHHDRSNVTVSLQDGADRQIAVRRGWLPMAVWEGVRVRVTSSRGLSLMERFTIECLLELGECEANDLFEVASIPAELSDWLMSSLAHRGLAQRIRQDRFVPDRSNCETALAQGSLPVDREEQRTFLWFPETEEFVCFPDARALVRQILSIQPVAQFPLPERWSRVKRAVLLNDALQGDRVYGREVSAICNFIDEAVIEQEVCPAYCCGTALPQDTKGQWSLTLQDNRRKRSQLTLPVLPRLLELWSGLLDSHVEAIKDHCNSMGLTRATFNGDVWQATVDGASIRRLAESTFLSEHITLAVQIDGEIEFAVPLVLSPTDDSAKQHFAVDAVVRQLLRAPGSGQAVTTLGNGQNVSPAAVLDRLWQLKLFGKVYELRVQEDFGV